MTRPIQRFPKRLAFSWIVASGFCLVSPILHRAGLAAAVSQRSAAIPPSQAASAKPQVSPVETGLDAYILGPGDALRITFVSSAYKDLGGDLELLNDGSTSLPMLGSIVLDGLTVNQATNWLRSMYGRYIKRPDLNLQVLRARPIQVSVVGEVESPGLYTLTTSETSQIEKESTKTGTTTTITGLPTVVAALQKAGGMTLNANLADVQLQRRIPRTVDQLKQTNLDLTALLFQGDKRQNPFLFDGDTIVVGKATTPQSQVMELAAANLSPQSIRVNVIGEVLNPGRVEVKANTPLVQAILAAGGPKNWRAKRSDVELVRINRNGSATRQLLNINYSAGVSNLRNPPLRDGDTVVVNRSTYAIASDAIGAIATPLTGLVNVFALVDLINNNK
jgi:polysaccharide export outer membrane protein